MELHVWAYNFAHRSVWLPANSKSLLRDGEPPHPPRKPNAGSRPQAAIDSCNGRAHQRGETLKKVQQTKLEALSLSLRPEEQFHEPSHSNGRKIDELKKTSTGAEQTREKLWDELAEVEFRLRSSEEVPHFPFA